MIFHEILVGSWQPLGPWLKVKLLVGRHVKSHETKLKGAFRE